jgi:hypothetical protein
MANMEIDIKKENQSPIDVSNINTNEGFKPVINKSKKK